MQFATLLSEGIAHCQQLGGEMWSDFNEHDPGMTILEQLCYAITEAAYRADLPVPDLLAQAQSMPAAPRDTLLTGDMILTIAPVSVDDYRKLLYDRVRNLNSVWITRDNSAQFGPLFDVRIETFGEEEQEGNVAAARLRVLQAARKVLGAHRNLGEDFASVELLKPFKLSISAAIEVEPDVVPTDVVAELLFALQVMLAPMTSVTSVSDLVRNGSAYDDIFNGPFTAIGIIGGSALPALKDRVTVEEIAGCIAMVAGVASVYDVRVTADDQAKPFMTGPIPIPDDCVARLALFVLKPLAQGENYRISVSRNGVSYPIERIRVDQHIQQRFAGIKNQETVSTEQMHNEPYRKVKKGTYRQVERYYSFQHQLPRTYGMGREGLSLQGLEAPARLPRAMQARQLKAYLLIFDQVLSDCFGQLGNTWQLFSLGQKVEASYFGQPLVGAKVNADAQPNADEPAHLRDWNLLHDSTASVPELLLHHVVHLTEAAPTPYIVLRSGQLATLAQARTRRDEILQFGAHEKHYRPVPLKHGKLFHIVLHNADNGTHGAIAFGTEPLKGEQAAHAEVRRLALLVRQMAHDLALRHAQLRIATQGHASVELLDQDGRSLLNATHLTSEGQARCVELLDNHAINAANYTIRKLHDGQYRLFLFADGGQVMQGDQRFVSYDPAAKAAQEAAAIAIAMCGDPAARARHVRLVPVRRAEDGIDFSPHRKALTAIWRKHDDFIERRNAFLDHLLARFGERFDNVALASFDPRLHGDKHGFYQDLIRWKVAFLRHCARLGSGRNQAYDYRRHRALGLGARSGLELRLFCLLGLLGAGGWQRAGERAKSTRPPFRHWRGQASSHSHESAPNSKFFIFASSQPALFLALLKYGIVRGNYAIEPRGHHHGHRHHDHPRHHGSEDDGAVEVVFAGIDGKRQVVHTARSRELAEREITRLIDYFGKYSDRHSLYAGEEMLLIEHVLLRPTKPPAAPAPAVDTDGRGDGDKKTAHAASADTDGEFYAFRLSLFFPDWPLRFQNPDFREFALRTVAQNCPVHLAAQCYWIDARAMRRLHRLHGHWMACKQAVEGDDGQQADVAWRHDAIIALNRAAAALRRFIRDLDAGAH